MEQIPDCDLWMPGRALVRVFRPQSEVMSDCTERFDDPVVGNAEMSRMGWHGIGEGRARVQSPIDVHILKDGVMFSILHPCTDGEEGLLEEKEKDEEEGEGRLHLHLLGREVFFSCRHPEDESGETASVRTVYSNRRRAHQTEEKKRRQN